MGFALLNPSYGLRAGGRARAMATIIEGLVTQGGIQQADIDAAWAQVGWD